MNIHSIYARFGQRFRARRLQVFLEQFQPAADTTVLDVGGYPWFWLESNLHAKITLLNPHQVPGLAEQFGDRFAFVTGDGCRLPYPDRHFDIVFSNSVIEHLGSFEKQRAFASEARRVGRSWWIQTPAREFFLEPHFLAPFIHWLPLPLQRRMLRYFTLWGLMTKPSAAEVRALLDEIRLLSRREMEQLFPGCHIHRERWLGLTKSYVAFQTAAGTPTMISSPDRGS